MDMNFRLIGDEVWSEHIHWKLHSFESVSLIYDLMTGMLVDEYIKLLRNGEAKIIQNEFAEGKQCEILIEENEKIAENLCRHMNIKKDEGVMAVFFDSFYRLLRLVTITSYQTALDNISISEVDRCLAVCRDFSCEMLSAGNMIRKEDDGCYSKDVDIILKNMHKVLAVFIEKATEYGKYFLNYKKSKARKDLSNKKQ